MNISSERQELRALAQRPIKHLSAYCADYVVGCRVGTIMAAHTVGLVNPTHSWALAKVLSDSVLRTKFLVAPSS